MVYQILNPVLLIVNYALPPPLIWLHRIQASVILVTFQSEKKRKHCIYYISVAIKKKEKLMHSGTVALNEGHTKFQ
jgi:hypothetical protein